MTIPRKQFRAIGASIEKIVKPVFGRRGFGEAAIVTDWAEIVGPVLAKHTFPKQISYPGRSRSDGTLLLRIDSSAMALELQHLEPQLREKINTYFGYSAIARIRILQVPLPESGTTENFQKRPLTHVEQENLDQRIELVSDPQLKAALSDLGSSIIRDG